MSTGRVYMSTLYLSLNFLAAKGQQIPETKREHLDNGRDFVQIINNGNVAEEGYTLHNLKDGMWNWYWETNIVKQTTSYREGKRNGVVMLFARDGFCETIEHYINDSLDGPRRVFGRQMNLLEETNYAHGKKHGKCVKQYASGNKQEESHFENGKRAGKTYWYYDNGQIAVAYNYKNGLIDGEAISYYDNGQVSEIGKYSEGYQTGLWREYYEDGKLKAEGNYEMSKKTGRWKEYDTTGKDHTVKY